MVRPAAEWLARFKSPDSFQVLRGLVLFLETAIVSLPFRLPAASGGPTMPDRPAASKIQRFANG
jgi:hypothetical protein